MESTRKKIAVADPRIPERTVLVSILNRLGYEVTTPETAPEIKLELRNQPNMIIVNTAIEGGGDLAINTGSSETRVLLLDSPPEQAPDIAGFFDITEHIIRGINVSVPEVVMLVNDFMASHPTGKAIKRQPRVAGGFGTEVTCCGETSSGVIFNLSATGAFIELTSPPTRGQEIMCDFNLPGREDHFHLAAKVTWSVLPEESAAMRSPPGCGVYFTNLSPEDKDFLEEFVTHKGRM